MWAVRALLTLWGPSALPAVLRATADPHWRVREAAFRVLAARRAEGTEVEEALARAADDEVERVRAAGRRAEGRC